MKKKNPAAVALGKLGGKARAKALTKSERAAISRKGALVTNKIRWSVDANREA